jgi:hypothetical protein
MATQAINLECVAFALVGSFRSAKHLAGVRSGGRPLLQLLLRHSGVEYTPERAHCQYLVAIFFCSSIECILPHIARFLRLYFPEVPVLESNSS